MSRLASIDIGSNTFLLLIVDDASGVLTCVADECDFVRLGQGLSESNQLSEDATERGLAVLRRYRQIIDQHEIESVRCVATQAVREATNRDAFVRPAEEILGVKVEIIAGEEEARLVATAVTKSLPDLGEVVCVDVGGASTEFIVLRGGEIQSTTSIPIGAVRQSERNLRSDPATREETQSLIKGIDEALSQLDLPREVTVVGTAGTATTLASIKLKLPEYDSEAIHGLQMSSAEVARIMAGLLESNLAQKRSLPGLAAQRADVITGGVAIYSRVLERVGATAFVVCDRGMRWGLVYEMSERLRR